MDKSYVSEITLFLRDLKTQHPEIEADQREGRAIFWDKDMDPDLYKRFRQSSVPQPAYVYQPRTDE
jgi:hypothetical protein